ncbi:MAG TPA: sigma-70 family RNA polymerase sigma factor [Candidatus Marinimicrobia bacterium]|nr:sigma-70 family RNA polymerase sigma factor [Candidatus Neomarinimicrobiota bacterium]HRS51054.1 sigma-70 family RNA polymerase sigma factor [Candidatus Neomarinimicrobiota bacterium]HRU92561.1 sigma-70 family RNA polymerase sigma factor [Candidatus Neomarinimicrobiota bacterium]
MDSEFQLTDEELISRFQAGDEGAFEEIVNRYADRLLNFAYRFVLDREEAEDIVQDTFLKVYQNRHAYREIAKFSTWIYTITGNLAKTILRKRRNRKLFPFSRTVSEDENKEVEYPSTERLPDTKLEGEIEERMIQQAIIKLPEHFRTVIILRDIQDLSYEEISNIIDAPLGTVKSRINRARLRLQEELEHLRR